MASLGARAADCNRSDLDVHGQDVRLRVERAGRQHRRLQSWTRGTGALTPIGKFEAAKAGHADDAEPEQKVPLCGRALAAVPRIHLRD